MWNLLKKQTTDFRIIRCGHLAIDYPKHLPLPRAGECIMLNDANDNFVKMIVEQLNYHIMSKSMTEISIVCHFDDAKYYEISFVIPDEQPA